MKRQFLINISLLLFLNLLIKPFWILGIDRHMQNLTGTASYGFYFALFNFSILFNSFLDLGITNLNNKTIAQGPGLLKYYFPRFIIIKLSLGIVYLILSLSMALLMHYPREGLMLMFILALNQILASFLLFLRSNISGLQMYITDSLLSAADRLLLVILCSILLWTNWIPIRIDLFVFAWLQTISYTSICLIAFMIVLRSTGKLTFSGKTMFSKDLWKKTIPFAILSLLMTIYSRTDAVLLERLLPDGASQAGIYAQSFRIFDAVNMVSLLFASLLLPMLANLLQRKKDIRPLINLAFSMLFSGSASLAIILTIFAQPLLHTLYTSNHPESNFIFSVLMICAVPMSLTYIYGTLLTAHGKLRELIFIASLSLIINMMINLTLIPHWGARGASLANLITQTFSALAQIGIAAHFFQFKLHLHIFLRYILYLASILLIALWIHYLHTGLIQALILCSAVSLIGIFIFKILNIRELNTIFFHEKV